MPIAVYKSDILISEPRLARTQLEKARGLMFSKFHDVLFHFPEEERLKFHMVFVFYAIDIIFMDREMRVVDLKPRFRPFTVYYSKARSSTVLETYNGFIAEHDIRIGDQLTITHDGEIPMATKRHQPETKMLHTTTLGAVRTARAEPVRTASDDAPKAQKPKTTTKRTVRTPRTVKKAAPKRPVVKAKTPVKKPAKRTAQKKRSTPKAPARTSTKKTVPRTSAAKKSSTVAKRSVKKKVASKKPAGKRAKK